MTVLRQSLLHALSQQSVHTITQLAQEIGYLRPSVSRALSCMKQEGLVKQEDGLWSLTEQGRQVVKTKEDVYTTHIQPLLTKIVKIAMQHDIPFVAACEVDGWLKIEKHHVNACSEIYCAYGELTGWQEQESEQ